MFVCTPMHETSNCFLACPHYCKQVHEPQCFILLATAIMIFYHACKGVAIVKVYYWPSKSATATRKFSLAEGLDVSHID